MGPWPITTTRFAGGYTRFLYRLQAGVHRLDERGFLEAHARGNLDHAPLDDPGHGPHVFGEAAAIRIEARGQPYLLVGRALRKKPPFAIKASAARNVVEADHAVALFPAAHAASDRDDRSGDFMPENLRRRDEAVLYLFQIRAANSAGAPHESELRRRQFAGRGRLRWPPARGRDIHPRAFLKEAFWDLQRDATRCGGHTHVAATISDCERSSRALSSSR